MAFRILAGSYERSLIGLSATPIVPDHVPDHVPDTTYTLTPLFILPDAHPACLRTLTVSPNSTLLASTSSSDTIKLHNLSTLTSLGAILHHTGHVTRAVFAGSKHLLSSSLDGTVAIHRARDWVVLKGIKGHVGGVTDIAVHASGALAVSIGTLDNKLRSWDLTRGVRGGATKIRKGAEEIMWVGEGEYALRYARCVEVYSVETAARVAVLEHVCRVNAFLVVQGSVLTAGEDGRVRMWSKVISDESVDVKEITSAWSVSREWVAHSTRVKAIAAHSVNDRLVVVSADSNGIIRVWNLTHIMSSDDSEVICIGETDVKCRVTCLALANIPSTPDTPIGKKRERVEASEAKLATKREKRAKSRK